MTDLDEGVVSKVEDEFELPSLFYCRLCKFASSAVACNVFILWEKKTSAKHKRPLICSLNSDLELRTRKSLRQRDTGCSSLKSSREKKRESKQLWPFSRFTVPPRGTHSLTLFHQLIFFISADLFMLVQGNQTRSIDPQDRRPSPQRCQLLSDILLLLLSFVLLC